MASLPPELFLEIFGFLSYFDLKRCTAVSWAWSTLIKHDAILQHLLFKPSQTERDMSSCCKLASPDASTCSDLEVHPIFSALSFRFGDKVETCTLRVAPSVATPLIELGIANDFVCLPPLTAMAVTIYPKLHEDDFFALSTSVNVFIQSKEGIRVNDFLRAVAEESRKPCELLSRFGGNILCTQLHSTSRPSACIKAKVLGRQRTFHSLKIEHEPDSKFPVGTILTTL